MSEAIQAVKTPIQLGNRGVQLTSMEDLWRFSQAVAASGLAPKGLERPEAILIAVEHGLELGLSPMQALSTIAVINGRPCLWGDGFKAVIEASPACEYVREWWEGEGNELTAWCETKRRNRPEPTRYPFSVADARRAGLLDKPGPWKQYLPRMLQMRARGFCLRDAYADVLKGISLAEEVMDYTDVRVVETRPLQRPAAKQISSPPFDDIPSASAAQSTPAPDAPAPTPEAQPPAQLQTATAPTGGERISEAQLKRLHTIATASGKTPSQVKAYLHEIYGYVSSKEITRANYDAICAWVEAGDPVQA